jgi:CPA2 family monovalent cation:H+ antiporter-2
MISVDSPVSGQMSSDIQRRYGVQVQAIRRDGKFFWFPNQSMDLKINDLLLLCGNYLDMHQVQQWLDPTTHEGSSPTSC